MIVSPEIATLIPFVINWNGVPAEVPLFESFPVATFTYHVRDTNPAAAIVVQNIRTGRSNRYLENRFVCIEASFDR